MPRKGLTGAIFIVQQLQEWFLVKKEGIVLCICWFCEGIQYIDERSGL